MAGAMRRVSQLYNIFKPFVHKLAPASATSRSWGRQLHASTGCSQSETTSFKIDVGSGQLHYDRVGTGNQVLLLLPGALGSSKTDFKYQIENLNKDMFTVIAWDPRGYGLSRPPDRTWPTDFLRRDADDAARLIKNLGSDKCTLLGWSDGGTTALLLALKYPDLVDKVIVWGAATYITEADVRANESVRNVEDWSPRMRAPFEEVYGPEYFKKLCSDWVDAYNSYMDVSNGDICSKELGNIKCPTLVIHGQKDTMVGQFHADHIHKNIPQSKYIVMADGKHNLHMRHYKVFNSLVEQFIVNPDLVKSTEM